MIYLFIKSNDFVFQINVDTGIEQSYPFPAGVFPFEPIFVARPEATEEDDGILLVQALDTNEQKGMVAQMQHINNYAGHMYRITLVTDILIG